MYIYLHCKTTATVCCETMTAILFICYSFGSYFDTSIEWPSFKISISTIIWSAGHSNTVNLCTNTIDNIFLTITSTAQTITTILFISYSFGSYFDMSIQVYSKANVSSRLSTIISTAHLYILWNYSNNMLWNYHNNIVYFLQLWFILRRVDLG